MYFDRTKGYVTCCQFGGSHNSPARWTHLEVALDLDVPLWETVLPPLANSSKSSFGTRPLLPTRGSNVSCDCLDDQ